MSKDKFTIKVSGCTVTYWKYTLRITLPTGDVFWNSFHTIFSENTARQKTNDVLQIFEAGKREQCKLFRNMLGIK